MTGARVRPLWRRVRHRVGHRGATLLFFAFVDYVYAWSLYRPAPERARSSLVLYLNSVAPPWVWASLWLATAVAATIFAFRAQDRLGFTMCIALKTLWSVTLAFGAARGVEGALPSVAVWVGTAAFLFNAAAWPEPPDGPDRPPPAAGHRR